VRHTSRRRTGATRDARRPCVRVQGRFDDQWVRILDVDAALGARTYHRSDAAVTIGVDDPMFAANCGVWAISATVRTRRHPPDVHVDIGTLSAAYLGAVAWHDLAAIGSVAATDDVLERLDSLFAVRPTPFCGTGY
jgi:predicted acetyltransferase